jgi:hypothetical protein
VAGRATAAVYRYLVVGAFLALTTSPTVVLLLVVAPDPSNVPLAVGSVLFVGPAFSAALFALAEKARDDGLAPAAAFWRGYRMNAGDVLKLWVPALLALAVLAFTATNIAAAGVPAWYAGILVGIAAVVVVWLVQATVIVSFFAFRTRDAARLGLYLLGRLPAVTLAVISALVIAGAVVYLASAVVFALLGVLWVGMLLRWERPLLAEVRLRFVHPAG